MPYLQKMTYLTCDYLVVGGGAAGMAFVDELIHHSKDLTVVMVDRCLLNKKYTYSRYLPFHRRAKPGGHWVDAYEFVRLHQPAAYYGVNSRPLENSQASNRIFKTNISFENFSGWWGSRFGKQGPDPCLL